MISINATLRLSRGAEYISTGIQVAENHSFRKRVAETPNFPPFEWFGKQDTNITEKENRHPSKMMECSGSSRTNGHDKGNERQWHR